MVGVFDSGIGGATVVKELIKEIPNINIMYYSDTKNCPYGDKSYDELINICDEIVGKLIDYGCKVIVIACNTASSICKDFLRNKYSIPIVAIEPAYKVVYDNNKNSKTLVMATKRTIESDNFLKLFHKYDNHNTILCSCSGLADLIEENNKENIIKYLEDNISKYKGVKNVVLGCTHYPLIKNEIKKVLGDVIFYDGSIGISKQTKKILLENNISYDDSNYSIKFIDSNNDIKKEKLFNEIILEKY